MDQYDLDFESILHHVDDMKSEWTEVSEKYKSILSSLKETSIKYEQTKIELESYKIRAKKAETEKDKMMLIVKELYKEKRLTNPFSGALNKLERLILTTQNDSAQNNHITITNSSIGEIPCRIVSSDISSDNTQQSSVDPAPLPITQVKTEVTETDNLTSDQDDSLVMANGQTLSINPNSIRSIHKTSTQSVHPVQQLFLNDELSQDETSEHDIVNNNEFSYEFVDFEPESAEGIPQIQNNYVDVDPLSLSNKSSGIRKSVQNKPVRSLSNIQQEMYGSNAMNVMVSLPRINVSNFLFRNSQSNDDSGILEASSSSTAVQEKRPDKSASCVPSPSRSFEENDSDILFDDDADDENEYARPRRCLICKKRNSKNIRYATYQDLDDHILKYHPEPLPVYRRCPYEDGKCRRHFSTAKKLQQHIELRHQNEIFVKSSVTHELPQNVIRRSMVCDESLLNSPLKNRMNQSHNGVSEPVKCQNCGKVFSTSRGLYLHKSKSRHCNRMIGGKSPPSLENYQFYSKCKICLKENPQEEAYYSKKNLDAHILRNHPNSYPEYFRCPHLKGEVECNRHLTSMSNYRAHVGQYHREQDLYISLENTVPGQKTFKCLSCGKRFLSKAHLLQHLQLYCD